MSERVVNSRHGSRVPVRRRITAEPRTGTDQRVLLSFGSFGWTIAFRGCSDVAEGLESILSGWRIRRLASASRRPDAQVTRKKDGFVWRSGPMPKPELWDEHPPNSAMHLICDIHDVLFDWFLKEKPRHLCLHGAAACIGDGLVCFPSMQKAGKSTLCMALAARGQTIFCDDVLPIEPRSDRGFAMGIAPRLRKPLPDSLGSRLLRFIAERTGPSDRQWVYVKLGEGELAPLGDVAPIKAFVLLRRGTRRTRLEPVSKTEMLKEILLQNFAHQVPPVETLDRLMQLTEAAACYRLRYDKVSSAALLLRKTFAAKKTSSRRNRSVPLEKRDAIQQPPAAQAHTRAPGGRFRRVPWVEAREVGNEFFLAAPRAGAIHHLDPMASAAWRILDQPRSSEEVVRLFQAAFPDAPRRKIAKDVGRLIESLEERGLIARAAAPDHTDRTGDASA